MLCRVIIFIFSRSHDRRSFTRRLVDETRLCVTEFTRDFSAKSQAASLAAVDAVRLNTDSAREASSRIARAAGKAHQKLERASYISALAKELHKTCVEEEEENRKEERQLKAALALIQSAGHSDRRSPQRSNRRYSPPSVAGHSDRRSPQRSNRRYSPPSVAGHSDRRPPHQSSGRSDRRNPSHPTSGQTDRRTTNQRDRSNTAGRISYYQSVPPDSQVHWTNKKVSSANNEPLGKRPVQPSVAAVTETASTSAQPTVEQQLPLQTLTLSEETPSLTTVPRPSGLLPSASELFIPTDSTSLLTQRCKALFGDQFEEGDIDILSPKEQAALSSEQPLDEELLNVSASSSLVPSSISVVDNELSSDVPMTGDNDE